MKPLLAALLGTAAYAAAHATEEPEDRTSPNVLFICVDDLAPVLGCDGMSGADTPNLDALAARGTRFRRHYAVMPTCGASRYAMWTGLAPTAPAHFDNDAFRTRREATLDATHPSLPERFGMHGYHTLALGKVSHEPGGILPNGKSEFPRAFAELPTNPGAWGANTHLLHGYANGVTRTARRRSEGKPTPLFEFPQAAPAAFPDALLADQACAALRRLKERRQPFFLAVGFFKPHLPLVAPRADWDAIDPALLRDASPLEIPEPRTARHAFVQSGEVTGNYACPQWADRHFDREERMELRRAYLAALRFVDAQIGRLLHELEVLELRDQTIVVLWGDHGWHLGEQGLFGKHTPYEAALRSALLIAAPGMPQGRASDAIVSSHDLYPTLCALAGIRPPRRLAGRDLSPLLAGAELPARSAISWWHRGSTRLRSIRTEDRRTVEWLAPETLAVERRATYELDSNGFEIRLLSATQ